MSLTSKATLEIHSYEANEERHLHFYGKGENVPLVTQGVLQVCQGWVLLSTCCPNGEEVLLGWAGPSTFFGLWLFQSLFPPLKEINSSLQPNLYVSYHSLSDVYLKWYSLSEIETSPRLAQAMLPHLGKRIRQTETLLAINGQRRVEGRLHQLLLLLKEEMGQPVAEGTRLSARLTHQHIANAIGTTRVTITRLLSKLHDQGLITIDANRHIILKDDALLVSKIGE